MAWVKIDDQIAAHPKVLKAGAVLGRDGAMTALGLVVWGLCYASRYLTDGRIQAVALATCRVRRPESAASALVEAGLWERTDDGYQIHDYADYQPSGEAVQAYRARRRAAGRIGGQQSGVVRRSKTKAQTKQSASPIVPVCLNENERFANPDPDPVKREKERSLSQGKTHVHEDPPWEDRAPSEAVSERAGEFVRWYETRYAEVRQSAYFRRPSLDFDHACRLVQTYPDDAWLRDMAEVYLLTDHQDAARSSRTIGQFTTLAGWCDARLRESGRRPAQAVAS